MAVPVVLLSLSLGLAGLSIWWVGPVLSQGLILSALMALASLILLVAGWYRGRDRRWIVVDGSNVMHWKEDGTSSIDMVARVVEGLQRRGYRPVVWFDANAGYKLVDRYLGPASLARALRLPESRVFVAPKGTPADPLLLADARRLGARVVTNDRFRDWAEAHPPVAEPGFLIRGSLADGSIRLHVEHPAGRLARRKWMDSDTSLPRTVGSTTR